MELLDKIISISVGMVLAGAMVPLGLQSIAGANMTGVDAAVATVFTTVVPIVGVVALVIWMIKH